VVWLGITVIISIITDFTDRWFDDTILETTFVISRQIEFELRDEIGSLLRVIPSTIEQSNDNDTGIISGGMDEISFNISVISVNGMLGWRIEFNSTERERLSSVGESIFGFSYNETQLFFGPNTTEGALSVRSWEMEQSGSIPRESSSLCIDVDW